MPALLPLALFSLLSSSLAWYQPSGNTSFLYTIDGDPVPATSSAAAAEVYDVDLFNTNASVIQDYKSRGKKVVCYFSAGSFELNRPDGDQFDPACYCNKGSSCKMDGWEEWWFDIHSDSCKASVRKLMQSRIALAQSRGCDAVDPDNVDSYTNKNGFGNTQVDQLDYNLFLTEAAHNASMGVGLKNGGDLLSAYPDQIVAAYDFVVIEQCDQYNECDTYSPFVKANKLAIDIEYTHSPVCKPGFFTLKYSTMNLIYTQVTSSCPTFAELASGTVSNSSSTPSTVSATKSATATVPSSTSSQTSGGGRSRPHGIFRLLSRLI